MSGVAFGGLRRDLHPLVGAAGLDDGSILHVAARRKGDHLNYALPALPPAGTAS